MSEVTNENVTNDTNVETSERTVNDSQQGQSVEADVKTTDNTNQVEGTQNDTEVDVDTNTDDTSEASESDLSELLRQVESKVKYMDKNVQIKDIDELVNNYQKGLDYERQVEKKANLENQLNSYNELVNKLYPEQIKDTNQLFDALIKAEIKDIESKYAEKYDGDDLQKVLRGDDRYRELKDLNPNDFSKEEVVEKFDNDVKTINESYGENFDSYKDIPIEVREKAADNNLPLAEAYKLVNFDKILNDKLDKTKKSLMAELSENKQKTTPKNKSKSNVESKFYTEEQLKGMSEQDMLKNWDKVTKSLKKLQK
jgi:hypothetical protein